MMKSTKFAALLALCTVLPSTAYAAPTIFFGENQSPANGVSGAPLTARNSFAAMLTGTSTETFESFANGATPANLTFTGSAGNIVATFAGGGSVETGPNCCGRYATSGSKYYETTSAFSTTFSTAIAAFGFYGTDIGDFQGQLSITLTHLAGPNTVLVVPHTVGASSGALLFYGLIDTANPFTGVSFSATQAGTDFLGFDDLIVGDARQVTGSVPEPATWAMMIFGFGLVGRSLRSRSRKAMTAFA